MKLMHPMSTTQIERLFEEAEGYLELELPAPALDALNRLSEEAREERTFVYNSLYGEALRILKQYDSAAPYFAQAIDERPEEVGLYINLGWCLKRSDRLDDAIATLKAAEQVCRKSNDMRSLALVLYNLSCYYSLAQDKEQMLGCLRSALSLTPAFKAGIADESDFDPWRDDEDFKSLTSAKS